MAARMTSTPRTANGMLRQWVKERIAGASEVNIPALRDEALAYWKARPDFNEALVKEKLNAVFYDIVQAAVAETRDLILFGDVARSRSTLASAKLVPAYQGQWGLFLERVEGKHMTVRQMRKTDLLAAARARRRAAAPNLAWAQVWETLAERLPDDDTVVADVWTDEEINQLVSTIREAMPSI